MMKAEVFGGIKVITTEAVAPDEVVMLSKSDGVRWTPDGGVESLSEYQQRQIRKAITNGRPVEEVDPVEPEARL